MKAAFLVVLLVAVACSVALPRSAVKVQLEDIPALPKPDGSRSRIPARFSFTRIADIAKPTGQIDHCGNCVQWASDAMQALIQALLNTVIYGCEDLCSQLPGQVEAAICNAFCEVVGIHDFIDYLNKADLDPIYYCQLMSKCEYYDNGFAKLESTNIVPKVGQRGNNFAVNVTFTVYNKTGAGEFLNIINGTDVDQPVVEAGALFDYLDEGVYQGFVQFSTQSDPQQGVTWHTGHYHVQTWMCMGECFSAHPHSKVFNYHNSTFAIQNSSDDDQQDDGDMP